MGNEEMDAPAKTSKASSLQEQLPTSVPAMVYSDWHQAFYNSAGTTPIPSPFFHSPVPSGPQAHPFMWGSQGNAHGADLESKSSKGKVRTRPKRFKESLGSLNMLTSRSNEMGVGASRNVLFSQSRESGSEASSAGSDANSQTGSHEKPPNQGPVEGDDAQDGNSDTRALSSQTLMNQTMTLMPMPPSGIGGPMTNLNIGTDYWSASSPSPMATIRGKHPASGTKPSIESWLKDEKERKRERRKLSNRESARRSRLRKQVECEKLSNRVENLTEEKQALEAELEHLQEECDRFAEENSSLNEMLKQQQGQSSSSSE
ncbi:bZIP transcription factor 16 isoform X2 [Amborella trichopoda]|uniref:bZIP transcription factor 16 isoform X2 n=1 Tax=Amborella trichopoda TaxID=13333 RepID=UPI0009BE37B5|nr:bZIP transcription factor 16 isoform X2 [Amborella trichopoda]|eukprot:XP_020517980.1 bZIP transcription factor 16 isoform X2 [Amborella trichopoda]